MADVNKMKQLLKNFRINGDIDIHDVLTSFKDWSLKNKVTLETKRNVSEIIRSKQEFLDKVTAILVTAYHTDVACGPTGTPNWKTYNQCDNHSSVKKYKKLISQGKLCVHFRKILWFIINNKEYPLKGNNNNDGNAHTIPIKESVEYLSDCKDLLEKANDYAHKIDNEILQGANIALRRELDEIRRQERERQQRTASRAKKDYGKEKHPLTNKMVSKCASDKERNSVSGNCRKKCIKDKEEVDSVTGKCRKKCNELQTRDPITGRCRKIKK